MSNVKWERLIGPAFIVSLDESRLPASQLIVLPFGNAPIKRAIICINAFSFCSFKLSYWVVNLRSCNDWAVTVSCSINGAGATFGFALNDLNKFATDAKALAIID